MRHATTARDVLLDRSDRFAPKPRSLVSGLPAASPFTSCRFFFRDGAQAPSTRKPLSHQNTRTERQSCGTLSVRGQGQRGGLLGRPVRVRLLVSDACGAEVISVGAMLLARRVSLEDPRGIWE